MKMVIKIIAMVIFSLLLAGCIEQVVVNQPLEQPVITGGAVVDLPEINSPEPVPQNQNLGDFKVVYVPSEKYQELEKIFQETQMFETISDSLNKIFILPKDVTIVLEECGEANAYYQDNQITICYELIEDSAKVFAENGFSEEEIGEGMIFTTLFFFEHELGHTLIDIYDLTITGREEDTADQFATMLLLSEGSDGERALEYAANFFDLSLDSELDEQDFVDEHGLSEQRMYNIICWVYGKDPERNTYLFGKDYYPELESRAGSCPHEYQQIDRSWDSLLSEHLKS